MFLQYFNLSDQPFGATPDPRFLFEAGSHREALASLYTGFHGNRGFTVLTAEPGMGKTTLLFEFLDHIQDRAKTVFLFNTLCRPQGVLSLILQDLGVKPGRNSAERHRQLNNVLVAEARSGRRVVLVIDEAQNLSTDTLEAVRLLTNFETARSKLMQIVLSGQPQLADKLARPEIAQLLQRVSTMCRLAPFTVAETTAYVEHRMKVAGYTGKPVFTSSALTLIADSSRGVPRTINTLCFNSLCLCRARSSRVVDDSIVGEAISDLQLPVARSLALTPQPEKDVPAVTSFEAFSEVRSFWGKSADRITAALLAAGRGIIAVLGSGAWRRVHLPFSVPAVFSHIRHVPAMKRAATTKVTTPTTALGRPAAMAPSTSAASAHVDLPSATDADELRSRRRSLLS